MRHFIPNKERASGYEQTLGISRHDAMDLDLLDQMADYLLNAGDVRDVIVGVVELLISRIRQRAIMIQTGAEPQ
jgi:hypothetical protein